MGTWIRGLGGEGGRDIGLVESFEPGADADGAVRLPDGIGGIGDEVHGHLLDLGVAEYKLPDRFRFLPALPLTAVGKIDKRSLRDSLTTIAA